MMLAAKQELVDSGLSALWSPILDHKRLKKPLAVMPHGLVPAGVR